jgi:hypothetical protein
MAQRINTDGIQGQLGYIEPEATIKNMIGDILFHLARKVPLSPEGDAVLEKIGIHRPSLTGVDMTIYGSPAKRMKIAVEIKEKREKLKKGGK